MSDTAHTWALWTGEWTCDDIQMEHSPVNPEMYISVSNLSFFQVKKSKFGRGSALLVRSGGLPQPLDLTFVNLWKLCEHQTLPTNTPATPASGGSNSLNWKTSPRNILIMEVMVECLGINWSKRGIVLKKGEVGDGGRIAGQSSNPSQQASLPSTSLNRWPPQMNVQCNAYLRVLGEMQFLRELPNIILYNIKRWLVGYMHY